MFAKLSKDYFVGKLDVFPSASQNQTTMNAEQHQAIQTKLYNTTPSQNTPVYLKLRNTYVPVYPQKTVEKHRLQITDSVFKATGYLKIPATKTVLLPNKNCLKKLSLPTV